MRRGRVRFYSMEYLGIFYQLNWSFINIVIEKGSGEEICKEMWAFFFVSDAGFCFVIWIPSYISNLILTFVPILFIQICQVITFSIDKKFTILVYLMDAIILCFNIEVYVFTSITQQKIIKIPNIF